MKKLLLGLFCLVPSIGTAQIVANGLSNSAQGDYVLLDTQQQATEIQFRLKLDAEQWLADGSRDSGQTWGPVCEASGECKLITSSKQDIERFFVKYPHVIEKVDLSCIHNMAFAFCGMTLDGRTDYVMVTLVTETPEVMPFQKIK